jgi:hypothetical protein
MAADYLPDWWPLLTAIQHVARIRKRGRKDADQAVLGALYGGRISGRHHGQPKGPIARERWARATIYPDGTVEFLGDPRFPHLQPPFSGLPGFQIEVQRTDVLKCWPLPRPRGPKPGTVDRYSEADRGLYLELERLMKGDEKGAGKLSLTAAARNLAEGGKVLGPGTVKSKAKRLAERYQRDRRTRP